jgi:tRNA A37 methylthiotransferase MiaB
MTQTSSLVKPPADAREILLVSMDVDVRHYPYGLYCLDTYVRNKSLELRLELRSFTIQDSVERVSRSIVESGFRMIGFSVYCWNTHKIGKVIHEVASKNKDCTIIVGGPSSESLADHDGVAHIVVGSGEEALYQLLTKRGCPKKLSIPMDPNERVSPYHTRRYLDIAKESGLVYVETMLGCPFRCSYCSMAGPKSVRLKDLDILEREIDYLSENGVTHVEFLDPTFNLYGQRMRSIIDLLKDRNIRFDAEIEPGCLNEESVDLLLASTAKNLEVGIQSVHNTTNRAIGRSSHIERFVTHLERLSKGTPEVTVDTIVGLPGEGLLDWLATIEFLCNTIDANIATSTLTILPNTKIMTEVEVFGYKYRPSSRNEITSSASITNSEIDLAKLIGSTIEKTWNLLSREERSALRSVVANEFGGSFSRFWLEIVGPLYSWGCQPRQSRVMHSLLGELLESIARHRRRRSVLRHMTRWITIMRTCRKLRRHWRAQRVGNNVCG